MAALANFIYQTTAFTHTHPVITISPTKQLGDVFARLDRQSSSAAMPIPSRLAVRLSINGEDNPVEFTYTTFGRGLPPWARPVLESLSERWGAQPGWDSYGAQPTNKQLVVRLLNILSDLLQDNSLAPQIVPLCDGGVQAEWHLHGKDLELVVPADGPPTYYYFNSTIDLEEEAELENNYASVQDLIESLG